MSTPTGISCGSACSATFDSGTSVTLAATAAPGSTFAGWSGEGCSGMGTCTVSMTQARSVTATFTLSTSPQMLTVTLAGPGSGTVTSSPGGINCGNSCSAPFAQSTSVTLSATAASDSIFTGWSGEGCSGTGPCTVSMTQARSVTATFSLVLSSCVWGLYIDDHHSGGDWEARLFVANIDTQQAHTYEVVVLATETGHRTSLSLGPSAIVQVTCDDVQACGTAGGLYVRSDAPVLTATLFVINNVFGGGAFTAETPQCQFGAP